MDEDGLVITDDDVATGASTVMVETADGSKMMGIVLAIDNLVGLALIRVSGDGYSSLPLGDGSTLEVGDPLLTLGFPAQGGIGDMEWELGDPPTQWFRVGPRSGVPYINTEGFLIPEYVGGPTVDKDGNLIGIATVTGLIVTVDYVREVLPTLRQGSDVLVPIGEEIVYTWLETTLSESFLFATDEEGTGERAFPIQRYTGSYVERSPDGSKIVYSSPRALGSNWDVFVANSDGSNEMRLTHSAGTDIRPTWGPRGEKLVFTSDRDFERSRRNSEDLEEIYIMNADGSNQVRLTNNEVEDTDPHISPDGSKIVFVSARDGNDEIYVMDIDGSNVVRLTNNDSVEEFPRWSPDGSRILFDSTRSGNADIHVMNADGSDVKALTDDPLGELMADWSPDGARIVYAGALEIGALELFTMNADGSGKRQITMGGGLKVYPRWGAPPAEMPSTPSNASIAFASDRLGESDIYRMEPSGNNVYRLTQGRGQ